MKSEVPAVRKTLLVNFFVTHQKNVPCQVEKSLTIPFGKRLLVDCWTQTFLKSSSLSIVAIKMWTPCSHPANKDQIYRMSTILGGFDNNNNCNKDYSSSTNTRPSAAVPRSDNNFNVFDNSRNMSHQNSLSSIFAGATFSGNCTFNIYYGEPDEKRRKVAEQ